MAYWLLKTEPEEFSWDDQVKRGAKGEPWTGVRNFTARGNLKAMKKGEHAFFYHTGAEKQVVGIVEIIREAYKDPTDEKGVFYAVDTRAVQPFKTFVTLAEVKADPTLKAIPVIAVTSYALSGDEEKARTAGCDGYIAKPFSPRQMLAKVREILG